MRIVVNLGVFQALWFGLIFVGDWFFFPVCCWWLIHYKFFAFKLERYLLPIFTVAGLTMDHLLVLLGVLQFFKDITALPLWMIGLWILFPTTLCHGLRWAWNGSIWLLPVCATGAALNYIIGADLASLTLPFGPIITGLILILVWTAYLAFIRRIGAIWNKTCDLERLKSGSKLS